MLSIEIHMLALGWRTVDVLSETYQILNLLTPPFTDILPYLAASGIK